MGRAALRLNVAVVPRATAPALRYVHGSTMTAATRVPPLLLDSSRMQLHDLQRPSSAATWATSRRTPRALSMRRGYANVLAERRKELEKLAALFSEARDEIE